MSQHLIKYHSIDNPKNKLIDDIRSHVPKDCEFVATEKIHGANMSIHIFPDGTVRFASRNRWLEETDEFNGYKTIKEEVQEKCVKMSKMVEFKDRFIVYGELFGGVYPNRYTPSNIKQIQKEIYYTNLLSFFAFDIKVDGAYMDFNDYYRLCDKVDLPYPNVIVSGTLDECLQFDVENFETPIPAILGLPPVENNFAEGVVIKPVVNYYHPKGYRFIVKLKKSSFSDVRPKVKILTRTGEEVDDETINITEEMLRYINKNTVESVSIKNSNTKLLQAKLIGLVVSDAISTFKRDNPDVVLPSKKHQKKFISATLTNATVKLLEDQEK